MTLDTIASIKSLITIADPLLITETTEGVELVAPKKELSELDGAAILLQVEAFLRRFISYPSESAYIAHVLWIAHTWRMDLWDSTPRIAFLSPEPSSGKSRCLEVMEYLVPRAIHAVDATPAYIFRKISDTAGLPTILYDEIDAVFGAKAKDNEDIRAVLNAGHRKGAVAGRVAMRGTTAKLEELPSYCAVALAGLNDLPDTIMSRSIIIRMKRRVTEEKVEPWRRRRYRTQAKELGSALAEWTSLLPEELPWPEMPDGITDRNADIWEALLVVADAAGGEWPERARAAAVELVASAADRTQSIGVLLLTDLVGIFVENGKHQISTSILVLALQRIEDSSWTEHLRGKPITNRWMISKLKMFNIFPLQTRVNKKMTRGFLAKDILESARRYCGPEIQEQLEVLEDITSKKEVMALPPLRGHGVRQRVESLCSGVSIAFRMSLVGFDRWMSAGVGDCNVLRSRHRLRFLLPS